MAFFKGRLFPGGPRTLRIRPLCPGKVSVEETGFRWTSQGDARVKGRGQKTPGISVGPSAAGYLDILYFVPATSLWWPGTSKPISEMGDWRLQEVSWPEISVLLSELWFELQSKLLPKRCSFWRGEWCERRRSSLVRFEGGGGEATILERALQGGTRHRQRQAASALTLGIVSFQETCKPTFPMWVPVIPVLLDFLSCVPFCLSNN